MHRPVQTFCSIVLVIAAQCSLLGCASRSTEPAAKEPPRPDPTVRKYGAEQVFSTLAKEGQSVPLHKAVEQLVPADYAVRWIDVDPSRRIAVVTWSANQEWPAAIAQAIAGVPGLTVDIGTGSRLVLIRSATPNLRPLPRAAVPAPATAASAVAPARDKKAVEPATAVPPAKADSGARLLPAGLRAGVTPEPVLTAGRPSSGVTRWSLSERDKTLKVAIERWAQDAGWRAFWELGVDYPIAATASIEGSFEDAVSAVVRSMEHADVPLKAIFYRGNRVLRMMPRGME